MAFSSNKNKELLWNTLIEVGAFNNIREDKLTIVKSKFDKLHTSLIHNEKQINLLELNKQFTLSMATYLNTLKNKPVITEVYNSNSKPKQNQTYENNFDNKKPNKVSFLDDKKDEPIKNIDELLHKMQKDRNIELPSKQDVKKAEQWLNNSNNNPTLINNDNIFNPTLNEKTLTDNKTDNKTDSKTDSKTDNKLATTNFFTKLKKNTPLSIEERVTLIEKQISAINSKLNI